MRRARQARNDDEHAATASGTAPLRRPLVQSLLLIVVYGAIAAAVIAPQVPHVVMLVYAAVLSCILIALSVVDLQQQRLPDVLTLPLLMIGLATASAAGGEPLAWSALAAAAGFAALWLIARVYAHQRGQAGMGLGDAKLLGAGGSHVGLEALPSVVLIAALTALIYVLAIAVARRRWSWTDRIAFGPFLALGIWIVWLAGPIGL